ncbi:helix-turn-helix domain-containing protein [Poseidonocella sedimentorum]|uniref:Transcriptional regulator, contains XRE-family HTH domain n=1 Tax=Poseidonocella sedimentorum TaxID=871652 RepID=A0A1I6EAA5_9RHOB|nr:helix-turn-helix domain-containing protein [Poseidonocella sedimentorum]SFR14646.1 Transcriptional regulator, contains XRE-family HTH domain [Poseidonocella sedimentorum]
MDHPDTLGHDIRALRVARKLTLADVAERLGRSVGWVSQIERGLSTPSITDLQAIGNILDAPISLFFGTPTGPDEERGVVVRAAHRREIGERDTGLIEALASPDLTDDFEVIHSTFQPGASLDEPKQRATTEVVYLLSGALDIWIDGRAFTVRAGDSFRIKGSDYRWANPYDTPAQALWVISPPVY